jgi:predicted RNA-binding Zn-ribbon protein involved in translation (DUF1610 family)
MLKVKFLCENCGNEVVIDGDSCEDTFECPHCGEVNQIDEECLLCDFLCMRLAQQVQRRTRKSQSQGEGEVERARCGVGGFGSMR